MRIAILGASGNAGRRLAVLLAGWPDVDLVLLGRDDRRLAEAADGVAQVSGRPPACRTVDADRPDSLEGAVAGCEMVVVASSTAARIPEMAEAVLRAGADWLDINMSSPAKISALRRLEKAVVGRGRCFITDGGLHPGVPGAMARYAGRVFDRPDAIRVAGCFGLDWKACALSASTRSEFLAEMAAWDGSVFTGATWAKGWRQSRRFDFGPPAGRRACVPMCMEEIRELPGRLPSLSDAGFWVAGFGPLVDWLVMPACLGLLKTFPSRPDWIARLFHGALRHLTPRMPFATVLMEASGMRGHDQASLRLRLSHPDPYQMTVIPIAACLRQYRELGRSPGVWTQAGFVEPLRFLTDMAAMGVTIEASLDGTAVSLGEPIADAAERP